jgi:hypothetical protein
MMEYDGSVAECGMLQTQVKDANARAADLQKKLDDSQAELAKLQAKKK